MPVTPTYPGVYVQEVPSGVRTIVGVGTSVTAFVGRAQRGPTNEPTVVNGFGDFERIFGGLWIKSRLGFAVRDFFLNGGGQGVIVRLFQPTFRDRAERDKARGAANSVAQAATTGAAAVDPMTDASVTAAKDQAKAAADAIQNDAAKTPAEKTAAQVIKTAVDGAAKAGAKFEDFKKAVDQAVANASSVKATLTLGDRARAAASAVAQAATGAATTDPLTDVSAAATKQAARDMAGTFANQPEKAAAEAALAVVDAEAKKDVALAVFRQKLKEAVTSAGNDALRLEAAYEGAWGNALGVRVEHPKTVPASLDSLGFATKDVFNLKVTDTLSGATETFLNLTLPNAVSPRAVDKVLENESRLVRVDAASAVPGAGDWSVSEAATDGSRLTDDDFTTGPNLRANKRGLYALEHLFARDHLFNLLVIPPYKGLDPGGGDVDEQVLADAAKYCEERRAMLLVDSHSSWDDKAKAIRGFTKPQGAYPGLAHKNAALLFPRLLQPNPLRDDQMEEFVPSGAVAGVFARTDTQRGVWKAPAGIEATLLGVPGLTVPLTDEENGELNPLGINCLRTFPIVGKVVWGSRTLRGADQLADEWKYIPIRRTALFLEESLYRGLKWVVFEPNDEPLWAQIRLNAGAFMQGLFRQGAFQGKTPQEAYFVKCDRETNPQDEINKGIVNVVVGFAPLKPAEFVIIKIQQMAGQLAA